ncbi:hypothetical protein LFYK43_07330 [Ligilactobacillus salitolerans]|uniref:Uncharacterized protein n=1 Tax=Ligilactobacillus salitolerans TaxID=1808352 RepID=A0A401IRZ3_9LACO|nr:hypothetical protein [Ligilactobacillus salitolerans]GBG94274.1 hypothetical protein LFYK43_07330 [Ligilactobacillus salitolerans]
MQLRSKEEAILYFGGIFPEYVRNATYQQAAVPAAQGIFTRQERQHLKNEYALNLLDPRVLQIDGSHYLAEPQLQKKYLDFCQRTKQQWLATQAESGSDEYVKKINASLNGVLGTEQIKRGALATFADVLADPFEPRVWQSYLSALPLLVKNDPKLDVGKIAPELNLLAALKPVYAETPQLLAPVVVSLLGPDELFDQAIGSRPELKASDNYLFYQPSRLLALVLAYFAPKDTQAAEHALLTLLLNQARHVLRGDLLSQPGYFPGSPNKNQAAAAFFADHPELTVLGFPVNSSGELDRILTDFAINSSLVQDLGQQTAFGSSAAFCSTQVCPTNLLTQADLDTLDQAVKTSELTEVQARLNAAGYQRLTTYLSTGTNLLAEQKSLLLTTLQKMASSSYQPHLSPRSHKDPGKKEAWQQAVNEKGSQESQQTASSSQPASPGGGGKIGLSGGDVFELNQRYFDQLSKSGQSQQKNRAEQMARQLLALTSDAVREAQVEFPGIDYSKYGGRLQQLKYQLRPARPLPPLRLELSKLQRDLAKNSKIEWYRRHYAFPERLDMAHISQKKQPSSELDVYVDVSGSISSRQLSKILSVLRQTALEGQSFSVRLFANTLADPVFFRARRSAFAGDFARLQEQLAHFSSSGTDLRPVFEAIVSQPQATHVIISDFCFELADLTEYQRRLRTSKVIFMNLYRSNEERMYQNQMPAIQQLVRQQPRNLKLLSLANYTLN